MATRTTIFYFGGSLVTPVRACPHFGTAEHPWVQLENCDCSNNIASIVRVAIKYLLELSPQNGVRPWAQITESWGTCSHPQKISSNKEKRQKPHYDREIHDSYIKAGIHPEFFQRVLAAAKPRLVSKSRFQPANHSHFV